MVKYGFKSGLTDTVLRDAHSISAYNNSNYYHEKHTHNPNESNNYFSRYCTCYALYARKHQLVIDLHKAAAMVPQIISA